MDIDDRFSKIHKDPRFKKVPKKLRKVKIDGRFKSMFTDKKFQTKYSIDKRGRPLKQTSTEYLEKFYELEDEDSISKNEGADGKSDVKGEKKKALKKGKKRNEKTKSVTGEISDNRKRTDGEERELPSDEDDVPNIDADDVSSSSEGEPSDSNDIRGRHQNRSKEDSSDEDVDSEQEEEVFDHNWGELDKDARREDNVETHRLAACNLDWDRVGADDLYVLFNSFVPSGGSINSVKIYPSEYGLQRMKEEDASGPRELKSLVHEDPRGNMQDDDVEGSGYNVEKLRQYQLQRLKYYYAIVDCDSVGTANKIYEECDNQEFELSATKLDLRFVPDDTTFDRNAVSEASSKTVLENYNPANFTNTALHQSRVKLTWDETDPKRMQLMTKAFNQEELEDMDYRAYLASSSSEEDDEVAVTEKQDNSKTNEDDEENRLKKYRALMKEIEEKEKEEDDDQDMEISWTPALNEAALKTAEDNQGKKDRKKKEVEIENSLSGEEDFWSDLSDDDSDVGNLEEDIDEIEYNTKQSKQEKHHGTSLNIIQTGQGGKRKKRKEQEVLTEEEKQAQLKNKEELELLLMEEKEEKQHFSLKSILERENKSKKKKLKRKKAAEPIIEDTFKLDVEDKRFDALFSSHHFALDPSDSRFRKTTATEAIIKEKQRRKEVPQEVKADNNATTSAASKKVDPSLSALVKSVKSRTEKHQLNKRIKKEKWRT